MMREGDASAWLTWRKAARKSPLHPFVAKVQHDQAAMRAALTLPWSTGPRLPVRGFGASHIDVTLPGEFASVAGGRGFNRAALVPGPTNRQGTLPRNAFRGFPVSQVDLAIRRGFALTERLRVQFRAEFFNILNHPNFETNHEF
jgi:hypothetical protein